jgi:hypothetical protein
MGASRQTTNALSAKELEKQVEEEEYLGKY